MRPSRVGGIRSAGERLQCSSISAYVRSRRGGDQRLVEVAEASLAREFGEHLVATLGGSDQARQRVAEVLADVADQLVGLLEPPVEDRDHRGPRRRIAMVGEKQPITGVLERGGSLEPE